MKDYTPIKRHPSIVSFSKDHHFGLLLVWKIRQGLDKGIDPKRISDYVLFFFKEDLEKHFREEEELLFAKLQEDDSSRKQAEADHESIYKLITAIENKRDDKILLIQLADQLEKHIRFEERELFNHLQKSVKADELEKVGERVSNNGKAIDETWKDAFWENKNSL